MRRLLACLSAVFAVAGCSPSKGTAIALHPPASPFTVLLAADAISVINTQKSVEDHVVSLITGMDCSVVRASMGDHYCIDTTVAPTVVRTTYCYKSLGSVSCYDQKLERDASRLYGSRIDHVPVSAQ